MGISKQSTTKSNYSFRKVLKIFENNKRRQIQLPTLVIQYLICQKISLNQDALNQFKNALLKGS